MSNGFINCQLLLLRKFSGWWLVVVMDLTCSSDSDADFCDDPIHESIRNRHFSVSTRRRHATREENNQCNIFEFGVNCNAITSVFKLYPPESYCSKIVHLIQLCGGVVIGPNDCDPFEIPLFNEIPVLSEEDKETEGSSSFSPRDYRIGNNGPLLFSSKYIIDSYRSRKAQDLNQYKIRDSFIDASVDTFEHVFDDFDLNQILRHEFPWSEIPGFNGNGNKNSGCKAGRQEPSVPAENPPDDDPNIEDGFFAQLAPTPANVSFSPLTIQEEETDVHNDNEVQIICQCQGPQQEVGRFRAERAIMEDGGNNNEMRLSPLMVDGVDILTGASNWQRAAGSHVPVPQNEFSSGKRTRQSFCHQDRLMLLRYVRTFKLHNFIKGNKMWKRMEALKVLGGEFSWSSMREHFTKFMLRRLSQFSPTDEDIEEFNKLGTRLNQTDNKEAHEVPNCILRKMYNIDRQHQH